MSDAAVDFDAIVEAELVAQAAEVGDALDGAGQELLSAEAGIDAHDEDMMHHRKDFREHFDRRGGIEDDAGEHAMIQDQLQGAVQVAAGFDLDRDHVGAGFGEGGDVLVGILDHEVAIEREAGDGADGLDDGRAEGDVGDEVAVHDVDVDDGAAAGGGAGDLVGEMREVCGEDGEG